jgi:hypothetical protein
MNPQTHNGEHLMPFITFTHSEVTAAMPKDFNEVGTAAAWELYTSQEGSKEAAKLINMHLYRRLTDLASPIQFDSNHICRVADTIHDEIRKDLLIKGETFGWGDTEPRWQIRRFVDRLFYGNE